MSKVSETSVRVRYGETDQMGFVYYGNYALYLELARTELIRQSGWSYKQLEAEGIQLPVVNLNVKYRKPAVFDDVLNIRTKIIGEINRKICFYSEIFNAQNELLLKGEVELVFMDKHLKKVMNCPLIIKEKMKPFQWI